MNDTDKRRLDYLRTWAGEHDAESGVTKRVRSAFDQEPFDYDREYREYQREDWPQWLLPYALGFVTPIAVGALMYLGRWLAS